MTTQQKIEALSLIQEMLGRSMHIRPIDLELTDEEVESMYCEGLIEGGSCAAEPEGERFVVVSILPAGLKLLMSKSLHVPQYFAEPPPKTIFGTICSTTANKLWAAAMVVLAVVATALLAAYLK